MLVSRHFFFIVRFLHAGRTPAGYVLGEVSAAFGADPLSVGMTIRRTGRAPSRGRRCGRRGAEAVLRWRGS